MVLPICGDGPPKDFFWMDCPVTIETTKEYCSKTYGKIGYNTSLLRPYWAIKEYGHDFASASNIIFSNGEFDPWSGGGWYPPKDYKGQLVNLIVKDGAHHYDLRGSHPKDTESVKQVRRIEEKYMKQWMGIP
ncbi:hypothetical protein AB6A40_003982 [Gnathostoma spinigerum]|uniref:Uncharacterized protein n=1 Tax=Gnathostoma spinigerum TaxID=75299 RepID=A0ABD6EB49_9BILA